MARSRAKTFQDQIAYLDRIVELKTSDYVPVNVMWTTKPAACPVDSGVRLAAWRPLKGR
jgi:hypothetical protein